MGFFSNLFGKKNYDDELKKEALKQQNASDMNQAMNNTTFVFCIDDVFYINGRGTIVTGNCTLGSAKIGDKVFINQGIETEIIGIEVFRKTLDTINVGENAGIVLKDIPRRAVKRGDILVK